MRTLLTETSLREGVDRVARAVTERYRDTPLTVVAVMTGSLVFLSDLIRRLNMPIRVSLIQASSYRGSIEPETLWIRDDMMLDVAGRQVLVIDDIFDTGATLQAVLQCIREMQPKSVASAVLLQKLGQQKVEMLPDFVAFKIPNEFVVGYGLDYQDLYRNLPYLAALEPSEIAGITV